eukprot:m.633514 g.633514  ORF g.633514 m.633514 type:complete len:65 (+) comp58300_c0_seq8:2214-2408(+)
MWPAPTMVACTTNRAATSLHQFASILPATNQQQQQRKLPFRDDTSTNQQPEHKRKRTQRVQAVL